MLHPFSDSGSPKHRQIADTLARKVATGELKPGQKLPTESQLAEQLKVSPQTIRQAKLSLIRRGMLVSTRRKGTFVTEEARLMRIMVLSETNFMVRATDGMRLIMDRLYSDFADRMSFRYFSLSTTTASVSSFTRELREYHPQAALVIGKPLELEACCRKEGVGMVAIHHRSGLPFVGFDIPMALRMGARYLAAQGISDIGVIGEWGASSVCDQWFRHSKTRPHADWIAYPRSTLLSTRESEQFGHDSFVKMWNLHRRPKGLVVLDDVIFKGCILAMAELGVKPGRDILVASHVNKDSNLYLPAEFVRLQIDVSQYVKQLARMLSIVAADPDAQPAPVLIKPVLA